MADIASQHETDTVVAARADARAQGGRVADAMPYLPASSTPYPPPGVELSTLTWAETVAGGNYTHQAVGPGTRIRLEDVTRGGVRARPKAADTVKLPGEPSLTPGHPLLSGDGRVLATIVADDSGQHDALCGTSTAAANLARYGDSAPQGPSPSGRELLTLAAAKHGLTKRDLPPTVSFFKGVRVKPDGGLDFTGSAGPAQTGEL